jgi:hypothetical protein
MLKNFHFKREESLMQETFNFIWNKGYAPCREMRYNHNKVMICLDGTIIAGQPRIEKAVPNKCLYKLEHIVKEN